MLSGPPSRDRPTAPAGERGRRSADRRSRTGVAGTRGRDGLPGRRVRGADRGRRRPRRQHQPDRLPGGLHRPVVCRPGRRDDLPADRQLRPADRRRPVACVRGSGRWSSPTPRRRCSTTRASSPRCCATHGIPAIAGVDTRALARHLRANGSLRGIVTAPGDVDRDAARRRGARPCRAGRTRTSSAQVSPAAITDVGARGGRRAADRDRRFRAQGEHRPRPSAGAARAFGSCRTPSRRGRGARSDVDGVILSPGPGDPARLDGPVALARAIIDDGRPLLGICLGHQIVGRAAGAETTPAAVRPSRREPPGPRPRARARPGHGPEPRGPGRRRVAAGRVRLPRQPGQPQRRLGRGAAPRELPIETVQYHPEGAPGPLDALAVFDRFVAAAGARSSRRP